LASEAYTVSNLVALYEYVDFKSNERHSSESSDVSSSTRVAVLTQIIAEHADEGVVGAILCCISPQLAQINSANSDESYRVDVRD
jgi:hypothetical protein